MGHAATNTHDVRYNAVLTNLVLDACMQIMHSGAATTPIVRSQCHVARQAQP
jgi:hypothetical protein